MPKRDWNDVWETFHALWGDAARGVYNKDSWKRLQELLNQLEEPDRSESPLV